MEPAQCAPKIVHLAELIRALLQGLFGPQGSVGFRQYDGEIREVAARMALKAAA